MPAKERKYTALPTGKPASARLVNPDGGFPDAYRPAKRAHPRREADGCDVMQTVAAVGGE